MRARLPESFGVLVTRPAAQAEGLCVLIEQAGGKAVRAPLLEIVPIDPEPEAARLLNRPDEMDWLVFVSANAVRHAVPRLGAGPLRAKVAAIGQATAEALAERGIGVDLMPKQQFNSESLLDSPELAQVQGKKFLLARGQGGREFLADALRARGAEVFYAEVYRRAPAPLDVPALLGLWRTGAIAATIVTSGEALDILAASLAQEGMDWFKRTPAVVIGERLAGRARALGCVRVMAAPASDLGVFDALASVAREDINSYQPRG
jgi:uroporphyrinogen-III synthase